MAAELKQGRIVPASYDVASLLGKIVGRTIYTQSAVRLTLGLLGNGGRIRPPIPSPGE